MRRIGWWLTLAVLGIAAAVQAAKPATVRLRQEGIALELTFENNRKLVVTSKGTPLDAGTYTVKTLRLIKKDDKGRAWELRYEKGDLSTLKSLMVEPEQDKVIDTGEPLNLDVWFWQRPDGKTVALKFKLMGKYSELYYPGAFLDGKRAPTPKFTIKDKSGKVLVAERLPMPGGDGNCLYEWTPPRGFTGEVQVDVEPVLGPFEWKYRRGTSTVVK